MNKTTKKRLTDATAIGAVAAVIGGAIWASATFNTAPAPQPTPSPTSSRMVVDEIPQPIPTNADRFLEDQEVPVAPEVPTAPEIAPESPTAPLEGGSEDGSTPSQPVQPAPEPEPAPEPAPEPPPPPVTCPAGSSSVASDGYNDTGCLPDVCFSLILPDVNHPECDAPFRP